MHSFNPLLMRLNFSLSWEFSCLHSWLLLYRCNSLSINFNDEIFMTSLSTQQNSFFFSQNQESFFLFLFSPLSHAQCWQLLKHYCTLMLIANKLIKRSLKIPSILRDAQESKRIVKTLNFPLQVLVQLFNKFIRRP